MRTATLYRVLAVLMVGMAAALVATHLASLGTLTVHGAPEVVMGVVAGFGIGVVAAIMSVAGGEQRMVMVMYCLHAMEQQQIADELGLSRGTVAATIFKARRKLAVELGTDDADLSMVQKPGSAMVRHTDVRRDPLTVLLLHVMEWLTGRITEVYDTDSLAVVRRRAGV
jgi:hypothetical protein